MNLLVTLLLTLGIFLNSYGEAEKKEVILKGKMLAKKCAWCHDINKNLLAPPFTTILERYKNVPTGTLQKQFFDVIKNGSKGRWEDWMKKNLKVKMGRLDSMYMPPQKEYYTDEEITLIVNWLLSLKN